MVDAISIHAPREGSDPGGAGGEAAGSAFQSTLPVRGATTAQSKLYTIMFISIHAPREGSDSQAAGHDVDHVDISIHAPREGSDPWLKRYVGPDDGFQSTLPVRGATEFSVERTWWRRISIHAPREGSDPPLSRLSM